MEGYLVLLAVVGLVGGAPQNWPYRDSLMPYRYGYPSQTQYKYLPQIEDDEDVGPFPASFARQDFVVGSDGDRVRPTQEPVVVPGVIETGSVAPVVEPSSPLLVPTAAPTPPPPRPVGPEQSVGKPVQPPPFPPARPPQIPQPIEEEDEDEDDDESDEEADDEDDNVKEEEGDHGGDHDAEEEEEEEEEEERRRQEPLNSEEKVDAPVVMTKPVTPTPIHPQNPSVPVVVDPVIMNKTTPPVAAPPVPVNSVEEIVTPTAESNEVKPFEVDDESSEEHGLSDGVEALVPGYVTDQGEVLVPVDTVTGDQPISIVPDPYTPPTRGVAIGGSNFRFRGHNSNPYFYSDVYSDDVGRQDSSEEVPDENPNNYVESGTDDEDKSENSEIPEGRNEFLTAFPPSRTPELYAVINGRFPVDSEETEQYGSVMAYRVKQTQSPSVSVAVALSGTSQEQEYVSQNSKHPYLNQNLRNPYVNQNLRDPYVSQNLRNPFLNINNQQQLRNPYNGQKVRNPYIGQPIRNPFIGQHVRNPFIGQQVRNPYIGQQVRNPYIGQQVRNPYIGQQVRNPYIGPNVRNPYVGHVRNPYVGQFLRNPYQGSSERNPFIGQYVRNPYGGNRYISNTYINRFVNRPPHTPYADFDEPFVPEMRPPYFPRPAYQPASPFFSGYGPHPFFGPQGFTNAKPVFINKKPGVKPGKAKNKNKNKHVAIIAQPVHSKPVKFAGVNISKKPTPVEHQDDTPYAFEDPHGYINPEGSSESSSGQVDYVQHLQPGKSRRAAKMAKKPITKKEAEKQKKLTDRGDPLNILKKVSNPKRS